MARHEDTQRLLLRDQRRALHAYDAVAKVEQRQQNDYRLHRRGLSAGQDVAKVEQRQQNDYDIAVNDLGANILRGGLCAALAAIQRLGNRGEVLLDHLATAGVPGLDSANAGDLVRRVRELDADSYMIATREMLLVAAWLKRAVQAKCGGS